MRRIRFPRTEQHGSLRPDPLPGPVVLFCDAGAPLPRDPRRTFFPASTIEAWPAAGGGLLLGIAAPLLYGAAPLRHSIKTVFIRIDQLGASTVIIPYVQLDAEARHCAAILVADELYLHPVSVTIDNGAVEAAGAETAPPCIIDLGGSTERNLAILAAAARSLLAGAAAELWDVPPDDCVFDTGLILEKSGTRSVTYGEAASDAALLPVPASVTLCSGERVSVRVQPRRRA